VFKAMERLERGTPPMADEQETTQAVATSYGTLTLVTISVFGMVTAMAMVSPLLVDLTREFDVSLGQAGLLSAMMSLPWALGAPFAGLLSDLVGRRPLILLSLAGIGLSTLATAFASDFATLLMLRFLAGVFGAFGPASLLAALGDLFPLERRAMAMSWFNIGFSLAAVAGVPAVGVVGGLFGWRAALATTGLGLLLLGIVVERGFPASQPTGRGHHLLGTYRAILTVPLLGNVLVANLLERSIYGAASLYLPSFLMLSYGLSAVEVALPLSLAAIGAGAGNVLGGWLGDRLRKATVFVIAQATAGAIGLALFGLPVGLVASALAAALFGVANAASRPAFQALSSELSPDHRGALLGLFSLTNHGGFVVGSALGGLTIELGGHSMLAIATAAGGWLAALFALPLAQRK
jgi:predicted MFS family arabinose efflux permease